MTDRNEADPNNATSETNATKSTSPLKSKAATASSDAPPKTSKKRRKVNHGKPPDAVYPEMSPQPC